MALYFNLGVETLSYHEIHSDLCELQRLLSPETDGDSSVDSEDVVESQYPVKPRKSIRVIEREEVLDFDKTEVTVAEIEHALFTIKRIMTSSKDLANSEYERDELEAATQGYFNRLTKEKAEFQERQKAQEHYLRLQQAFFLRALSFLRGCGQNAQIYGLILRSLQHFRNSTAVKTEATKAHSHAKAGKGNSSATLILGEGHKVRLCDHGGDSLISLGYTCIATNFGPAVATQFDVQRQIFTLKLQLSPDTLMYSPAASVLVWLRRSNTRLSVTGILQTFHRNTHQHGLLTGSVVTTPESNDKEKDSTDEETMDVDVVEEAEDEEEEEDKDEDETEDSDIERTRTKNQLQNRDSMLPLLSTAAADGCVARKTSRNHVKRALATHYASSHRDLTSYSSSSSNYNSINYSKAISESNLHVLRHMSPAAFVPTTSKKALRQLVHFAYSSAHSERYLYDLRALDTDGATLLQAEAASSPHSDPSNKQHDSTKDQQTTAGKRNWQEVHFASGQAHCWQGDVSRLRESLTSLQETAQQLEAERVRVLKQLMIQRAATMRHATQCATQRLQMFTRRHLQRQQLPLSQQQQQSLSVPVVTANASLLTETAHPSVNTTSLAEGTGQEGVGGTGGSVPAPARSSGRSSSRARAGSLGTAGKDEILYS
jgi:hypothetical protein